ncbi:terpene synthase family protein [Kitasatospora azatica]|uniref:terpene synthase family protein n=1 Tax=Kitasatospora azatica TaxID=58347 RepID=UPI00068C86CF|nr:hypothetical protein [Kitasatospora azatica]
MGPSYLPGPTGIGTAATLLPIRPAPMQPATGDHPPSGQQPGPVPALHCPPALRDDPVLAEEVNTDPRVRRAVKLAAGASTLVNDLYSMARQPSGTELGFDLPQLIAQEEKCSLREAADRTVEIHDELVRTFEIEAALLSLTGSPQLWRFLMGLWAWLGGNREWHAGSPRYNSG